VEVGECLEAIFFLRLGPFRSLGVVAFPYILFFLPALRVSSLMLSLITSSALTFRLQSPLPFPPFVPVPPACLPGPASFELHLFHSNFGLQAPLESSASVPLDLFFDLAAAANDSHGSPTHSSPLSPIFY